MNTHRFAKIAVITALAVTVPFANGSPANASGPEGSTTAAEKHQCSQAGGGVNYFDLVGPKGKKRPGIGQLVVVAYDSPTQEGDTRICAYVKRGDTVDNRATYTSVHVGSVSRSGGTPTSRFSDTGKYRLYTDGRAITPSNDRCGVAYGRVDWAGKKYSVEVKKGCN